MKAEAGPCRDPAIPAVGAAEVGNLTDDLDFDLEVPHLQEEGTFGVLRGLGSAVAKEERWIGGTHFKKSGRHRCY